MIGSSASHMDPSDVNQSYGAYPTSLREKGADSRRDFSGAFSGGGWRRGSAVSSCNSNLW